MVARMQLERGIQAEDPRAMLARNPARLPALA
jgi:hypothetical protein